MFPYIRPEKEEVVVGHIKEDTLCAPLSGTEKEEVVVGHIKGDTFGWDVGWSRFAEAIYRSTSLMLVDSLAS